jgi:hypothetical protein
MPIVELPVLCSTILAGTDPPTSSSSGSGSPTCAALEAHRAGAEVP